MLTLKAVIQRRLMETEEKKTLADIEVTKRIS